MHHFSTLFDRNYISRGLALYRSLTRCQANFRLHIVARDSVTSEALSTLELERANIVPIEVLEKWDLQLLEERHNRSPGEFYFTCKLVFLRHLFDHLHFATGIAYLD